MNRKEFATHLAYLSAGIGKQFSTEQAGVYFDLLGDLDVDVFGIAIRRALLDHKWPNLPTICELRQLAAECTTPRLSAMEAWELVRRAVKYWGYMREREGLESLPDDARRAASAIGWRAICDSDSENLDTIRAQFRGAYESIANESARRALLPAPLADKIADHRVAMHTKRLTDALPTI